MRKELTDEEKRVKRAAEVRGFRMKLESVSDLWPAMPVEEQKMILATVFENIIVDGEAVRIVFSEGR